MTEIPDEFEDEEEVKQYLDLLYDRIEFLEADLEESEKKLKLKQELNDIEDKASASNEEEIEQIHGALEELVERIESIELHGKPSDVGLQDSLRNPDFGDN